MNLEEIKKLCEECELNVDALDFEMAIPVAELLARGENEAADKFDKENRANEKCDELKQDIAEFYSDECR